ncbi:MAG: spermidine/putrescine ABC transporter substrate-binding protein [Deltaproteobacteria bacterium]|jgi:spermidine/putrescine transport system substrate-binding protein|nr:spermidine/putrescine ABC transporter substrate-binding protein [Deltaproteobacteria bacterium]
MSKFPFMHKVNLIILLVLILVGVAYYFVVLHPRNDFRERSLTLFIWSEYIDEDLISEFERDHGVKVNMDWYESNEEMIAKLGTGREGVYDIIVPSTYSIPALKNLDLIQPLDRSLIPNMKNIADPFTSIEVDPGNLYTVPYQYGTSGLAVRAGDLSKVDPSWELLYDQDKVLGEIVLFDTARDALGSALKYLGYSLNTTNIEEIKKASELLIKVKGYPNFFSFDSGVGGLNKVMGGVAATAQVYNGEAVKAAKEDPELHYVTPKEGCEIWLDLLAIPKNAPNLEEAHEFLNFILEPQVGARLATFNNYATPNKAALPFIPKEDLENSGMYPTPAQMENMEYMKDLGPNNRLYDEAFNFVKSR